MFIGLLVSPSIVLYHIIIHAFFKSALFILAGTLIHASNHYQNLYRLQLSSALFAPFIANNFILVTALSKELLIYSINYYLCSLFLLALLLISTLLTLAYTIRLLFYIWWLHISHNNCLQSSSATHGNSTSLLHTNSYYGFIFTVYFGWVLCSYSLDYYFLATLELIGTFSICIIWAILLAILLAIFICTTRLLNRCIQKANHYTTWSAYMQLATSLLTLPMLLITSYYYWFSSNHTFHLSSYIYLLSRDRKSVV